MILVLGTDDALLEGLAQALAASGQQVFVARTVEDAEELAKKHPPLLLVADRGRLTMSDGSRLARVAFAVGGAVVAYRSHAEGASSLALPSEIARMTLADLELPLERNRLVALALYVAARAREAGRIQHGTPPESAKL
jgi:NAD(P)-dependent dehydrogenase (short-subunit alcohol dehydrogenase family)